ncbi:GNAT family N-acetyltransferase [Kurthia senegalensis]
MKVEIRKAVLRDAAQLLEVIQNADAFDSVIVQLGEVGLTVERIEKWMKENEETMTLFVAVKEDRIVGYLMVQRGKLKSTAHCGTIAIGVHSDVRGEGVGTDLFEQMHDWARKEKFHRLDMMVLTNNVKGIFLFRKMGYTIESTKQDAMFIDGRYIDEYLMVRFIDQENE